jgi:general secretion pathway protein A
MYTEYFRLKEVPFSIAPDPRFFFMSDRHKEALTHLTYGLQGAGGFIMLTGEVGTGKTTVSRALVQELSADTVIGYVHNPAVTELELLATLCDEFNIEYTQHALHLKPLFDALHQYLLSSCQQNKPCVVIIDEAQLLSTSALEQLRLLTNLDSENKKLLHIVLVGQPELQQKLKQAELRQLAQRITARYHLLPLTESELASYVAYRLSIASGNPGLFNSKVLKLIYRHTQGIPRLVNLVCDKALNYAFSDRAKNITPQHIKQAANAVLGMEPGKGRDANGKTQFVLVAMLVGAGVVSSLLAVQFFPRLLPGAVYAESATVVLSVAETEEDIVAGDDVVAEVKIEAEERNPLMQDRILQVAIKSARQPKLAMQYLYKEWGFDFALQDATCRNSQYANLRCLQQQGIYAQLVQYNLPALVQLRDNFGEGYYATLLSITPAGIELLIQHRHVLVTQVWFEKYWSGEFTLLWTAPSSFKNSLKLYDKGELVRWLDEKTSDLLGVSATSTMVFDDLLAKKVVAFQLQAGLTADGIVGPQTMMLVAHNADATVPKLDVGTHLSEVE